MVLQIMSSGANHDMEHGALSLITSETLQLFRRAAVSDLHICWVLINGNLENSGIRFEYYLNFNCWMMGFECWNKVYLGSKRLRIYFLISGFNLVGYEDLIIVWFVKVY